VSGPFMVEGVIYGIIATIVTLILFLPITFYLGKNMTAFLGIDIFSYYVSNLLEIGIIILLSGVVLGVCSSIIATRKYLNK
jgi:cell division protein FtsX